MTEISMGKPARPEFWIAACGVIFYGRVNKAGAKVKNGSTFELSFRYPQPLFYR